MVEKSKLDEDKEGKAVDPSHYRGMIGTLLYLTASRPDLQFAICMCARYHARPTEKHVHAIKRIFRYLRGTIHRGLWYPKDSSVALTAFADADHADGSLRTDLDRSIGTDLDGSLRTNLDRPIGTDLDSSLRTDLDRSIGTDLDSSLRTDLDKLYWNRSSQFFENRSRQTMATTIEKQVALDEALVPSTKRLRIGKSNFKLPSDIQSKESTLQVVYDVLRSCPFFKAFLVTADVLEIYMQEFWATAYVHQYSIRFELDNKKHIVDLETFRDMLHICPRIRGQSFDELPFEAEILKFLSIRKSPSYNRPPTNLSKLLIILLVLSILSMAWIMVAALSLSPFLQIVCGKYCILIPFRRSSRALRTSLSHGGSGTDEGTGSKPGVSDVPFDDSEEEISWNSSDDEETDTQEQDRNDNEGDEKDESDDGKEDDDDDKDGDEKSKNDEESDDEEIREEESFDPIPRTPEDSEDDGNGKEDQGLRISEEERIHEEEEADELYLDVDINQERGLQVSQDIEDSHVTLTPVHPNGQQVSSSVSSQFVTSMLNPTRDVGNQSIQRSNEQRNLYKALVEAYEADKIILDTYGERVILERRRDDDDDQGRSTTGSKSRQASASESAFAEEPVQTTSQIEEPSHPVFETGAEDQPIVQTSQHPEWFSQPKKPPTPDRNWNKTLPAVQGSAQTWISELAKQADSRSSFNELLDTSLDFSNFIMNQVGVDTLTLEHLARPTYELMRGSCNSLTELEYHLEELYKATTDQLDWVNPEGQQYPHNLLQPLSLIPDNRDRRVIPFAHFINHDLEYLRGGASSQKYTTSVTKTKAADYGH
nr:uncharacterized mitochondrial protein AtMg00810-like [Tanacetum cinerariifolium]